MEEEGISYVRRGEQLTSIPSKVLDRFRKCLLMLENIRPAVARVMSM